MMSKFKVGDRVRLVADNDGFGVVGDTGSIVKADCGSGDARVRFDVERKGDHEWYTYWDKLQHIYTSCAAAEVDNLADEYGGAKAKFKVGDRVRLNREGSYDDVTGTIVANDGDSWRPWKMDLDPGQYCNGFSDKSLWVDAKELEHVTAAPTTLRIEAGKFYKTRDGRKVGPMEAADSDYWWHEVKWSCGSRGWYAAGNYWTDGESENDLIAEWTDEPVAAEPKFKVGDKVKNINVPEAGVGIVTEVRGDGEYQVHYKDTWYGYCTDDEGDMVAAPTTIADIVARHSQTGTAIVCRLDNGAPRPAGAPFVHTTASAAETEANRLARNNPGKEFGVYTLGTVAKVEKTYDHEWQRLAVGGKTYEAKTALTNVAGIEFYQAAKIVNDWREDLMRAA